MHFNPDIIFPPKTGHYQRDGQIRFLQITSIVLFFAGIIFGFHNIAVKEESTAIAMFALTISASLSMLLNKHGKYYLSASIITIVSIFGNYYNYYDGISLYDPGLLGIPLIIIFTAFLFGRKSIPYFTLVNVICVLLLVFFERNGTISPPNLSSDSRVAIILILTLMTSILIAAIMSSWENAINNTQVSEQKLRDAFNEISATKDDLEIRVRERTMELEELNAELKSFAYSVSHDLKSPLRAVIGFSNILNEEHSAELSDEAQDYLSRILLSSNMMSELIDDMLFLSRATRKDITLQIINLSNLAEEIFNSLMKESDGRVIDFISTDCPEMLADYGLMKILLTNLISNSIKFLKEDGTPIIEFGCKDEGEVIYFIRDNGIGFDQKSENKIFEPFKRLHTKGEYEGTGIGLAIAKRIVHRHRGRIWAESEVGKGTTFYFTIGKILQVPIQE